MLFLGAHLFRTTKLAVSNIGILQACLSASAAMMLVQAAHAAPDRAMGDMQDIGPTDPQTSVGATLWLKPQDEAGFESAVASRMTPGSPHYHHWMTRAEVAAAGADKRDVARLVAALQAAGLIVEPRGIEGDALRVVGPAGRMEAVFGTHLRDVQGQSARYRVAEGEPNFIGDGAGLVAGITGLTTVPMRPYVLHQIDFSTGKNVQFSAKRTNPASVFTTQCFSKREHIQLGHFVPNGGSEHADLYGPGYIATGVNPAKNVCGYSPHAIADHYHLGAVYAAGYEGEGQTIVLVDAYGSPTIQSDANLFSSKMGLPQLTAANFQIVYSDGPPIANPYPTGWPVEISLDVEWAHAMAPKAKIVLVVAPSDDADELAYALHYAVSHGLGEVISNSYGYPESEFGPATARAFNSIIARAAAQGIAVNVSTGDSGDNGLGTPYGAASIPADSSFATGVGGTSLDVPSDRGPVESAWGTNQTFIGDINGIAVPPNPAGFIKGGGGGESAYLSKPLWQHGLPGSGRQLPDVSAVADPFTGAIIVTPNGDGTEAEIEVIGGTSLSSPVFSGIWALADQAAGTRLGQAAPIIANMPAGSLIDIVPVLATKNNLAGTIGTGTQFTPYTAAELLGLSKTQPNGFVGTAVQITSPNVGIEAKIDVSFGSDSSLMALPGWDNATGYGVPNGLSFIHAAVAAK
jgi:subtilase family serine protease